MKAAYIEETGTPDVIKVGDLPEPAPGHGQVLVKVHAVALNPIDLYLRSGLIPMPLSFPYMIGCDLAGTVAKLGSGASRFKVGDRVWGSNQGLLGRQGVAAEFAAVDEDWLYPTPSKLSDQDAAAMALVGITAHLGLFRFGGLKSGETVYVPGGSGGVGSIAIQMARATGARAATCAGSPERVELCRSLGADLALNYKTDNVPARLREFAPEGVDIWFETQREPNLEVTIPLLRKHGRLILMAGLRRQAGAALGRVLSPELRDLRLRDVQLAARGTTALRLRNQSPGRRREAQSPRRSNVPPGGSRRRAAVPRRKHAQGRRVVNR